MSKLTIKVNPKTGQNYLPRHIRDEGFTGRIEVLVNAVTVTLIKPGSDLADVNSSLNLVKRDIALRRGRNAKGVKQIESQKEPRRQTSRPREVAPAGPHPVFIKYTRTWLNGTTGYSLGYLCRVATGKIALSQSFIERVCFKLNQPREALFLLNADRDRQL